VNPFGKKETDSSSAGSTDTNNTTTLSTDSSLVVQDGDTVNIDYVGSIDGVEFAGGNTQGGGADLTIGSGMYIDDFEEQLIGAHPGDEVDVYATFPSNYGNEELNGKEALFKVKVNGIYK
jgi:trigger factor